MQTVSTIGLDIAKSVFQVHGVDDAGQVVIRRQLKRRYVLAFFQKLPPCLGADAVQPYTTIAQAPITPRLQASAYSPRSCPFRYDDGLSGAGIGICVEQTFACPRSRCKQTRFIECG